MKTSQLIATLKKISFQITRFPDIEEDNRPLLDTPDGHTIVEVGYTLIESTGVTKVPGIDIDEFVSALPYGSTLRIPTYYNRKLYSMDIYTKVEKSESERTWLLRHEFLGASNAS